MKLVWGAPLGVQSFLFLLPCDTRTHRPPEPNAHSMPAAMHCDFLGATIILTTAGLDTRGRAAGRAGGSHERRTRAERGGFDGQPLSIAARAASGSFPRGIQLVDVDGDGRTKSATGIEA